jgi:hypothetical protein
VSEDDYDADKAYEDIVSNLPAASSLARKRKLKTNSGVYGRKKRGDCRNIREKSVLERKRDFPDAPLKVVDKKLYCTACDKELKNKGSTIKGHLMSKGHQDKIEKKKKNLKAFVDYAGAIKKREREENTAGSTIPIDTLAYRMKVTHALLKAGAPFSVLDNGSEIRELFEDGHCCVNKDSCSSFIPALNDLEAGLTMTEIRAANGFSICSDGTMNVAECLAIVSNGLMHLIMMMFKILLIHTTLFISGCTLH